MTQLNLGPHLLGRLPSPPDERDFQLADYLDPLEVAMATLRTSHAAKATKAWAEIVTSILSGQTPPAPPSPTPTPAPVPATKVVWSNPDPVLNQGNYGTCLGNGWAQWGNSDPINDHYNERDARAIYYLSTQIGGAPDDPDAPGGGQQGSTVRDGAKAMQQRGRLQAYAFAKDVAECRAWVQNHGTIVVGTIWTNGMFSPDANGYVRPLGSVAGGHCYLLAGDLIDENAALFLNSWGADWGLDGYFKMLWSDFGIVLAQDGEVCTAVETA